MVAGEGYLVAWWVEETPPRNFHCTTALQVASSKVTRPGSSRSWLWIHVCVNISFFHEAP